MNTRIKVQAGRSSFQSLAILFGLALLSFSIFAAPPNAPVFTALDDQELDPPSPDGRYSLDDATRGLPFTVDTPIPPRIVAEQVVTPSTLGNYINTPSMRLILEPGNYGNLSIGGTDKEIVFTTGVTVGELYVNGQRIAVRANPARTGTMSRFMIESGATDVLLDGVYTDAGQLNELRNCVRVAIINSRLRQVDYVLSAFSTTTSHVIVANNYLETYGSAQAAVRWQSLQNLVFVDNNVRATGGNGIFRLHTSTSGQKADNLYVARNQFEGPFWFITKSAGGDQTVNGMGSVWVEENSTYHNGLWWIHTGNPELEGWPEVFTLRNNNAYIGSGGWPTAGQHPWDATFENNTEQAFTAPPAWEHQ